MPVKPYNIEQSKALLDRSDQLIVRGLPGAQAQPRDAGSRVSRSLRSARPAPASGTWTATSIWTI